MIFARNTVESTLQPFGGQRPCLMDESGFAQVPVLLYGINLLCAAIAYFILERRLIAAQGKDGALARAVGKDWKGKTSPVIYLAGIALTFVQPLLGVAAFTAVALIWLVPDRRVEHFVVKAQDAAGLA